MRLGMVDYEDGIALTKGEAELIQMACDGERFVQAWREEDGLLVLAVTDDGMTLHGWFDSNGDLVGDWV